MKTTKTTIAFFITLLLILSFTGCNSIAPNDDFGIEDTDGINRENAAEIFGEVVAKEGEMDYYEDGSSAIFRSIGGLNTFSTPSAEYDLRGIQVGELANEMFDELDQPNFLSYPLNYGAGVEDMQVLAHYFIEFGPFYYTFSVDQEGGTISEITFSTISFLGDNDASGLVGDFTKEKTGEIMRFEEFGRVTLLDAENVITAQGYYVVYDNYLGINILDDSDIRQEHVYEMTKNDEDILLLNMSVKGQNTMTGEAVDLGATFNHTCTIIPSEEVDFGDIKIDEAYKTEITENSEIARAREIIGEYQEIENVTTNKTKIDYASDRHDVTVINVTAPGESSFTTYAINEDEDVFKLSVFDIENYRLYDSYWEKIS